MLTEMFYVSLLVGRNSGINRTLKLCMLESIFMITDLKNGIIQDFKKEKGMVRNLMVFLFMNTPEFIVS